MRKAKPYNDIIIALILTFATLAEELTVFFFNRTFALNFFGVLNDIIITAVVFFAICFIPDTIAKKTVFTLVFSVISLLFITDGIYSTFFAGFASVSSLTAVDNLNGSVNMGGAAMTVAAGIVVAEAAAGIFFIWFISVKRTSRPKFFRSAVSVTLATVIAAVSLNATALASVKNKNFSDKADYYTSSSFLYNNFYDSISYAAKFGYFNFRVRDIFFRGKTKLSEEELNAFYSERENAPNASLSGIFDGYNVITVTCETFDTRVVNKELMPNFTNVMENSVIFDNYYVPTFFQGATINSEFLTLTGLYPIAPKSWGSVIAEQYKDNDFSGVALPGQLKKAGYATYYMHLGGEEFYSRNTLMPNMGFDTCKFATDLDYSPKYYDYELADLLDSVDFSQKFYIDMLTFSMHTGRESEFKTKDPSNVNYENYKFVCENFPNVSKESKIYFAKARVFDEFVKRLMKKLEDENVADNTIILFYPDHCYYMSNSGGFYSDLGVDRKSKELYHQFLTMYLPDSAKEKLLGSIDRTTEIKSGYESAISLPCLCSSADIAPTLLNLVSRGGDFTYFSGQDAFSENNVVFFSDYTVYDGEYFYNLKGKVTSDGITPVKQNPSEDKFAGLKNALISKTELSLNSSAILDLNYFTLIENAN